ncbi:hypothetical protein G647_10195 [Cladophialophora carrionii CBS 160.54]|uniref:Aldehyde dehydrogenase domain-containing protein n=1 Tax=Cladophialophora carrionii CBS 160.54 TaxID=1279043 RepID=V9DIQ7_9EURO|nr:uncharacterized protein G647_10195 [Cladophialophora carrionii CBS 160.54]ETI26750.1 hypothetical protein G647_10195 [Cladophialophora carrionii CBS 160.54]
MAVKVQVSRPPPPPPPPPIDVSYTPQVSVTTLPATAPIAEILSVLERDGGVILKDLVSAQQLKSIETELQPWNELKREDPGEEITIVKGGRTAPDRPNGKGFYIEPTVVSGVNPSMRVYKEEIFGPFLTFTAFTSEEDVVKLANDAEYGLGSAVFTNDVTRAIRVARDLQAGLDAYSVLKAVHLNLVFATPDI